jgi:hypothetical protein
LLLSSLLAARNTAMILTGGNLLGATVVLLEIVFWRLLFVTFTVTALERSWISSLESLIWLMLALIF